MSVFGRTRTTVDGEEHDLFVEVRKMDVLLNDDGRTVVLLDDFAVLAGPGTEPVRGKGLVAPISGYCRPASSSTLPSSQAVALTPLEVRALQNAISPETMHHWGWQAEENGRVTTDTGRTVFAAGFVTAIRKALATARPERP